MQKQPTLILGIDLSGKCQIVQSALFTNHAMYLVSPDGSLTNQGRHTMHCIRMALYLEEVLNCLEYHRNNHPAGLDMLAGPTGCDGVVNTGALKELGGLGSIISLLP